MAMQNKGGDKGVGPGGKLPNGAGKVDPETMIREFYDAFNRHDVERMMTFVAREMRLLHVPTGETFSGHDGFRHFTNGRITAFPDLKIELRSCAVSEGTIVCEFTARGTHTGPMEGPMGHLAPTNKRMEMVGCEVWEVKGGQLAAGRIYFDAATMMRQLGMNPTTIK